MAKPSSDPESSSEMRDELASVAASLRAYLEWQEDTGALGIPRRPKGAAARGSSVEGGRSAGEEATAPSSLGLGSSPGPVFAPPTSVGAHASFVPPSSFEPPSMFVAPASDSPSSTEPPPSMGPPSFVTPSPNSSAPVSFTPPFAPPASAEDEAPRSTRPIDPAFVQQAPTSTRARAPVSAPASAPVSVRAPSAPPRPLPVIEAEAKSCTKCGLAETRKTVVFSRGNPDSKLCFVGEAPGADEDETGFPFVGRAGQLLDKMIGAMGLDPAKDVYVCNIIKCRPPGNRRPETVEVETCIPYLHEQLATLEPKVIVALGNTAVAALLGTKLGITKVRGQWKLYKGKVPVMPTFHPSFLLRPTSQLVEYKKQAWEDLQAVMKELGITNAKK